MKAFLEYKFDSYISCEIIEEPKLSFGYNGNNKWSVLKIKTNSSAELLGIKPKAFMITLLEDDGLVIKVMNFSGITEYKLDDKNFEISIRFDYLAINY